MRLRFLQTLLLSTPFLILAACAGSSTADVNEDAPPQRTNDTGILEPDASLPDASSPDSSLPDSGTDDSDVADCQQGTTLCDGSCVNVSSDPSNCGVCGNMCPDLWSCEASACVDSAACNDGFLSCSGSCVDTSSDRNNCGTCGTTCEFGDICEAGSCILNCGSLSVCDGECVNTNNTPQHCGACNSSCGEEYMCANGQCVCLGGQLACDGTCIDVSADSENCGSCGNVCEEGSFCQGSECACSGGRDRCDGLCTDVSSSVENCGACGTVCDGTQVCVEGVCNENCPETEQSVCSSMCVNTSMDESHCGGCDNACREDQQCETGNCECGDEELECGGICRNLDFDIEHCGECDNACRTDQACNEGTCECQGMEAECNDICVDQNTDPSNCGSCNNICPSDHVCGNGECICINDTTECDGVCQDLNRDPLHCGDCDASCDDGDLCFEGGCTTDCPDPLNACDGTCIDFQNDPLHCGECELSCAEGVACLEGECACTADMLEPNNLQEEAFFLPIGDMITDPSRDGLLANLTLCQDDRDFFRLGVAGRSSSITVTMFGEDCNNGDLLANLTMTNDDGTTLGSYSSSGPGDCPVITSAVSNGYVYLDVSAIDSTTGAYGLQVDYGPFVEGGSNESTSTANGNLMRTCAGRGTIEDISWTTNNDKDYWSVVLTHFSNVTFETTGSSGTSCGGDTILRLYNSAGEHIISDDDGGNGNCSRIQRNLVPALYYLRAEMNDAHDGLGTDDIHYQLLFNAPLNVELEPNDSTSLAGNFGAPPFSAEGGIQRAGDLDLYALNLSENMPLNIYARGVAHSCETDLRIRVLAEDGTTVIASATEGLAENDRGDGACPLLSADNIAELNPLPAGNYFVEVSGDEDNVGPYILNVIQN